MKKPLESVTPEHFAQCEQDIRRLERRRVKMLAGHAAGWMAGDIIFLLFFLSALFCSPFFSQLAEVSPFRALGSLWRDICSSWLPFLGPFQGESFSLKSMLAAILFAAAANLLVCLAVRLVWVVPRGEPPAAQDSGSVQAQARSLQRRCAAAVSPCPFRRWYISLIVAFIYAAVVLLPPLLAPSPAQSAQAPAEELGPLALSGYLIAALALMMLQFLLFYLIYRSLSGAACQRLDAWYTADGRSLERGLSRCAYQLERQDEPDNPCTPEEQRRLQGDELYRRAIVQKPIDEDAIAQAADLGCRPACLYLGRRLLKAWSSGDYTPEEKRELAEAGKEYFRVACGEEDFPSSRAEAELGYLAFVSVTESATSSQWQETLEKLRSLQSSGLLPGRLAGSCSRLIRTVTDLAEETAAQEAHASQAAGPSAGAQTETAQADGI